MVDLDGDFHPMTTGSVNKITQGSGVHPHQHVISPFFVGPLQKRPDFLQQKSAVPFFDDTLLFRLREFGNGFHPFFCRLQSHRHCLLEEVGAPPKMSANYGWWPYDQGVNQNPFVYLSKAPAP